MTDRDPFEVLRVKRGTSKAEIRQAYLKRAKVLHPDRFNKDSQSQEWQMANEMLQELNEAYAEINQVIQDVPKQSEDFQEDNEEAFRSFGWDEYERNLAELAEVEAQLEQGRKERLRIKHLVNRRVAQIKRVMLFAVGGLATGFGYFKIYNEGRISFGVEWGGAIAMLLSIVSELRARTREGQEDEDWALGIVAPLPERSDAASQLWISGIAMLIVGSYVCHLGVRDAKDFYGDGRPVLNPNETGDEKWIGGIFATIGALRILVSLLRR